MDNDIKETRIQKEEKTKGFIASLPLFAKIFYLIALFSVLLFLAYTLSESFSDFFNRYISSIVRAILAYATRIFPFSLAEMLLILVPVLVVIIAIYANKHFTSSWREVGLFCTSLLSILALFFSLFTFAFAPGYHGTTLDKKLMVERKEVSAEELYDTAILLAEKVNDEIENISFEYESFSVMPYSFFDMNDELMEAYGKATEKYTFIPTLNSRLKPVMLSKAMSYTHITGVYTFFTGEANINVNFPDYTLPFTAAHELAHQRGIAREDEANFVAYLVCIESDDAYIRYSGYLNLFEYVSTALWRADTELYKEAIRTLNIKARYEMVAYSEFFDEYRDSVASDISGVVNDTYLTLQGTAGTASYGMVVDLAVAYYGAKQ